jgi:hypothetical protein
MVLLPALVFPNFFLPLYTTRAIWSRAASAREEFAEMMEELIANDFANANANVGDNVGRTSSKSGTWPPMEEKVGLRLI